jgi:hypothetical protein
MKLSDQEVCFIKYFVQSYNENFRSGKIKEANHDATALILLFDGIFNKGIKREPLLEPPK